MNISRLLSKVILTSLAVLVLLTASCHWPVEPAEPAVNKEQSGPPPSGAGLFQTMPPQPEPLPQQPEVSVSPVHSSRPSLVHQLPMMIAALVILFLVSVLIFHTFGRQLRRKGFKAHAPTSHLDIWATHKPPQFLDP